MILYFFLFLILGVILIVIYQDYQNNKFNNYYNYDLFKESPNKINDKEIPKTIHKIFLKPGKPTIILDNLFEKIKKDNPEYKFEIYDDDRCIEYLKKNFDEDVLYAFNNLKPATSKSDLMRYCILYNEGGIYGDAFQDYYYPLNKIINHRKDNLFLVLDRYNRNYNINGIQVNFLAAQPKLKIFYDCIKQIIVNVKNKDYTNCSLAVTGPILFSLIFHKEYLNFPYTMKLKHAVNSNSKGYHVNFKTEKKIVEGKVNGCIKSIGSSTYGKMWETGNQYY
jgi:mannosyltransferase OCH1-like enzyme